MKWIKHKTRSHGDQTMVALRHRYGTEGYGVWWLILEHIALQMESNLVPSLTYPASEWAVVCGVQPSRFRAITKFLASCGSLMLSSEGSSITVTCPNLLKIMDEYSERKVKKLADVGTLSGECRVRLDHTKTKTKIKTAAQSLPTPEQLDQAAAFLKKWRVKNVKKWLARPDIINRIDYVQKQKPRNYGAYFMSLGEDEYFPPDLDKLKAAAHAANREQEQKVELQHDAERAKAIKQDRIADQIYDRMSRAEKQKVDKRAHKIMAELGLTVIGNARRIAIKERKKK